MLIDGESKKSGSVFEDFEPPINPPEEIDDPEDSKPEDWVDTAKCVWLPYLQPPTPAAPADNCMWFAGRTLNIDCGLQASC